MTKSLTTDNSHSYNVHVLSEKKIDWTLIEGRFGFSLHKTQDKTSCFRLVQTCVSSAGRNSRGWVSPHLNDVAVD